MPLTLLQKGKRKKRRKLNRVKRDLIMGINVSTSMGFENRDFMKRTAEQILKKSGADKDNAEQIVRNINYSQDTARDINTSIFAASAQITLNKSLKETLRYLQAHANDKRKQYILGELWNQFSSSNEKSYKGELINFEVNYNALNIFAA